MPDTDLPQADADALMAAEKHRIDEQLWDYPVPGGATHIPLTSADKRENFILDISRGNINLLKGTYQNRARQTIILVRLDFHGPPHRNPDDTEVACPHLHVYKEGFGDKWATPAPTSIFHNTGDLWQTLEEFMAFCNITQPPMIRKGLFT
jgi:hypothetical protein